MADYISNILHKEINKTVVGDRIHTDIELGKKLGADTVLVCSGEYQASTDKNHRIKDTQIFNTLTDYLITV